MLLDWPPTKITLYPDLCHSSTFSDTPILHPISGKTGIRGAMTIMILLILLSLLLAAGFLLAYLRAAGDGQFDDEYTPAVRMLFDDPVSSEADQETTNVNNQQDEDLKPSL